MIDLDAIAQHSELAAVDNETTQALVAELRAARVVVEAARRYEGGTAEYQRTVWAAIGNYDEAVAS